MAGTATPIFPQTPISTAIAVSATANTSRAPSTGFPTNGVLISPNTNTNGVRVDKIMVNATGTTLAGIICIWLFDGTTAWIIDEILVSAVTANTNSTVGFQTSRSYADLVLAPGCKLYATSQVASQLVSVGMTGGAY